MSNDGRRISESLVLDDSSDGVIITEITDDKIAAKSGLQAGDEIVAATIHLDHLNKNEVLSILKTLEPYDNNMKVLTKKELSPSAGLGSFGLGLNDPTEMINLKKNVSLDASTEAPVVSLNGLGGNVNAGQGLGGEISGPTLNGDLPNLSLTKPSSDAGGKFTVPSLGLTGPDVKGDLDGTFKAPDVRVSTPQLNTPSASVNIEKPDIKTGKRKYDAPKFTMPHFNLPKLTTPKAQADVSGDVDLPSIRGNVETPDLSLSAPPLEPKVDLNADYKAPSGGIKLPFQNLKGPTVKGPDADLSAPNVSLSTPKVDGNLGEPNINFPKAIKGPDVDVKTPNLDTDAQVGKFSWPWKTKKPKMNGPKSDLSLDAKTDFEKPDLEMQTPNMDVDAPSGKINWPHLNWRKPKLHGPNTDLGIDADVNTPNLSSPKIEGDINGLDVDPPSGKINWPHLKWKKPRLNGPKRGLDVNTDLSTPDVNLSGPKVDGGINTPGLDLNSPNAEVNVDAPDVDIDAPTSKIKFPTLKKPKFLLSGPKGKTPDVDLEGDLKAIDLSVPPSSLDGPNVDVNAPNVDIDAPSGKLKFPTLRKPKWAISGPKVDGPDVDLDANVSAPDLSGSGPKIGGEINAPSADLEGPKIDINAPDVGDPSGKFKWFNFKKPKFGTLKAPKADIDTDVNVPDVDLRAPGGNLSAPKIEGGLEAPELNVSMPNADIKGPDVDVTGPDFKLDSPDGKLKLPKLKLPKLKGPKVQGPELDADLKSPDFDAGLDLPKVDVDAPNVDLKTPPKIKGSFDEPDLDTDVSGKLNMPKIKLPKLNIGGPKAQLPDADIKLPTADIKASNVNVTAPKIKGDFGSPNLGVDADLNTDGDIKAPKSNISLNADVKGASLDLPKSDFKGPDAQLKKPDHSSLGDFKLPHFKLPKLGLSDPDVEVPNVPSVKSGVETPEVNIAAPKADANISVPAVDLSGPNVKGDIEPNVDLKTPDADLEKSRFSHFKLPKLNFSGSKGKAPEFDTNANVEVSPDVTVPGLDVGSNLNKPNLGITADADADVKGSPKSKLRWPFSWGRKSVSDEEGSGVESETDISNKELEVPAFKFHRLPRSIGSTEGIDDALGLPKIDTDARDYVVSHGVRLPRVNATLKPGEKIDIMERLKMAKEKIPSVNTSPTEAKSNIDLKLAAPGLDANASTEPVDSSLVRGGTFKVEKPESALGLVVPAISTSDENDKLSLSLSNMLGLNITDSDAD